MTGAALAAKSSRYRRQFAAADAALLSALEASDGGKIVNGALHARRGTIDYRIRFVPKQQRFIVSVVCPLAGRFRITRKNGFDRWAEGFVPARRLPSRDTAFDRAFTVQTRDEEFTSAMITSSDVRRDIRALFDAGVIDLHVDGDRVKATGLRKELGTDGALEPVIALLETLGRIGETIKTFAARHEVRPAPKHDTPLVVAWTSVIGALVLGIAALITGASLYTLLVKTAPLLTIAIITVPATALAVFVLSMLVSQRTAPGRLVGVLALITLIAVPLLTGGMLLLANGLLDEGPARTDTVTVVDRRIHTNKGKHSYRVAVDISAIAGERRWLRVTKDTYEKTVPGESQVALTTSPGALGMPWIEGFRPLP